MVAALAVATLTLAGCATASGENIERIEFKPGTGATSTTSATSAPDATDNSNEVSSFDLQVGDCVVETASLHEEEVTDTSVVPCSQNHAYEVYANFQLTDISEFDADAIDNAADAGCTNAFEDYVGISRPQSSLKSLTYSPTEKSWKTGDRLITCLLYDPAAVDNNGTTQSFKGAKI